MRILSKYHELVFAGPWGNCLIQVPPEFFMLRNHIKTMTLARYGRIEEKKLNMDL